MSLTMGCSNRFCVWWKDILSVQSFDSVLIWATNRIMVVRWSGDWITGRTASTYTSYKSSYNQQLKNKFGLNQNVRIVSKINEYYARGSSEHDYKGKKIFIKGCNMGFVRDCFSFHLLHQPMKKWKWFIEFKSQTSVWGYFSQ